MPMRHRTSCVYQAEEGIELSKNLAQQLLLNRKARELKIIKLLILTSITVLVILFTLAYQVNAKRKKEKHLALERENFQVNKMLHISSIQRSLTSEILGTRHDYQYSHIVNNKAFLSISDLQTTTVSDVDNSQHVFSNEKPTLYIEQVLLDNLLDVEKETKITDEFVSSFVRMMTLTANSDKPLLLYIYTSTVAEFVLKCLKEQAHVLLPPNVEISQRRKYTILSGSIDWPSSHSFFVNGMDKLVNIERDLLDHPLLHHWYGQNGDIVHPKFTSLPIGVDFHTLARQISRQCHQTPPEQGMQMIEPLLKDIDVKRLLPSYVHLHSVDLHPRFAPGESDDDRFDFSLVDWAIIPKKRNKSDHVQELKWTSFDKLDDAEHKVLSKKQVDFGIIIEGVSRNNSRQYEQYYTANNDRSIDANNNQEYLSRIALQRIDDQDTNTSKNINRVMLYATLSDMYMYALRTTGFGHPTLRETKVLLTFNRRNYPVLRDRIKYFLIKNIDSFAVDARVKRNEMWSMMRKYAFVASPPGIGYDCHRTWEALALGCIPIVVHPSKYDYSPHPEALRHHRNGVAAIDVNASLELYDDLPVVIVNNFEQEVNINSLRQWQTEIYHRNVKGEYHLYKLLNQYWLDRFLDRL